MRGKTVSGMGQSLEIVDKTDVTVGSEIEISLSIPEKSINSLDLGLKTKSQSSALFTVNAALLNRDKDTLLWLKKLLPNCSSLL